MAQNQQDYDDPGHVLQRYSNAAELQNYNIRRMRGIMNHFNIPFRDDNGIILPQFRTGNNAFILRRQPYIDAIIAHFRQPPQDPVPQPAPNPAPNIPVNQPVQQPQNVNFVEAFQQLLRQLNESKEQKFNRKFHGKKTESIQDFIKYCKTYKELYSKTDDWIYKKILTNGFQGYAAKIAHDNRGISFYDLKSLFDWSYRQFYGEEQLDKKQESWERFRQEPNENIDSAYHRYLALLNDYKVAISFAAERGANSVLNVPPTEKESFTYFINGLYKETQLILLTQIETQNKSWNLQSVKDVMRSVKALTVSSHGLNLKYSHNARRYNNRNKFSNEISFENSQTRNSATEDEVKTPSQIRKDTRKCYNCNEIGHIAPNCPKKKQQQIKPNPMQTQPKLSEQARQKESKVENLYMENPHHRAFQNIYEDHFMIEAPMNFWSDDEDFEEQHSPDCCCWSCSSKLKEDFDIELSISNLDENEKEKNEINKDFEKESFSNEISFENSQTRNNNSDSESSMSTLKEESARLEAISVEQPKEAVIKRHGQNSELRMNPSSNQSKIDKITNVKPNNEQKNNEQFSLESDEFMKRKSTRFKH